MNAAKTLEKEITQSLAYLNEKQKRTVLTVVQSFMEEKKDWWDEIGEEQQQAIDKSLAEMQPGKLTPHEVVMKKYKKWLK